MVDELYKVLEKLNDQIKNLKKEMNYLAELDDRFAAKIWREHEKRLKELENQKQDLLSRISFEEEKEERFLCMEAGELDYGQ